ncbi:MAG TPA: hypothetical protein DCE18_18740 [Syntrophobacteraceae bacterium]|nr:hypothetical protein [Syntrophobacteraceae bacterium]
MNWPRGFVAKDIATCEFWPTVGLRGKWPKCLLKPALERTHPGLPRSIAPPHRLLTASMKPTLRINPAFATRLKQHGLDTVEQIMGRDGGKVMRQAPGRITVRLNLAEDTKLYLKRHFPPSPGAAMDGLREWDNMEILRSLEISCPTLVAAGCGIVDGAPCSFLITEEVPDAIPLDDFLSSLCSDRGGSPWNHKRHLIRKLADLARKLHRQGHHHKDFYLCHLFINQHSPLDSPLTLIDLQRLGRAHWFRRRWIVKDLAALNYSARVEFTTHTDRLRFLLAYLGRDRLDPRARRLIRAILRKTERIRRHDLKLQAAVPSLEARV